MMMVKLNAIRNSFVRQYSQYKSTVHLPQTTFPAVIKDRAKHEEEVQQICKFDDLYQWQSDAHKHNNSFTLHDGPPYANGDVHVGHALNKILKDITNRYKLLCGYQINYKPGWDCHGLPIETKAIQTKNYQTLTPVEIRRKAKIFAEKTIEKQITALRKWGLLADWNNKKNCYFTFNKPYQVAQLKYFYKLFKDGLVYRDLKPVYWSPSSKTALAESELVYNGQHVSKSVYVSFPIVSSSFSNTSNLAILSWTTQPWTLPANQALCYSPDSIYCFMKIEDTCYVVAVDLVSQISKELGVTCDVIDTFDPTNFGDIICSHPMDPERRVCLYPADHATTDIGTGIVHTAPPHGVEDFQIANQHNLPSESNVDNSGCFTAEAGYNLKGKFIFEEGNDAVIESLKSHNTLLYVHEYKHNYPYDWRTNKPIFVKTSRQWFIDTNDLKERALSALSKVEFLPPSGMDTMRTMVKQRPYWCISRQRVWGVPIPVFYHKESNSVLINDSSMEHIFNLVTSQGSDVWFTSSIDDLLPSSALEEEKYEGSVNDFEAGRDILDIWFDSGVSWAAVIGEGRAVSKWSPVVADMYLEGMDQFNGWFLSSLLTSTGLQDCAPYKTVMVHGFCVSDDGQKMSKSRGNVIDPAVVVEGGKNRNKEPSYGADTLRWWAAQSNISSHVQISKKLLDDAVISVQKIRACIRFLISNLYEFNHNEAISELDKMPAIDQYFAHALVNYAKQVSNFYNDYKYTSICRGLLNFITKLSTVYFSIVKDRLYCCEKHGTKRQSAQSLIYYLLEALIKTVAPILPHLAEEAVMHHPCPKSNSAFKDGWFETDDVDSLYDLQVIEVVETALRIREAIFSLISDKTPSMPTCYDVNINTSNPNYFDVLQHESSSLNSDLCEILSCAKCTISRSFDSIKEPFKEVSIKSNDSYIVSVSLSKAFRCPRCRKNTADANGHLCKRCTNVLTDGWDD